MTQTTCPPLPNVSQGAANHASEAIELRKKLLAMIRHNESMRRKTQK